MKKLLMVTPLVILLCFTFGCQQGEEVAEIMSEQEKEEIAQAVVERLDDYVDAVDQLDFEQAIDFWADTDGFAMAGDGSLLLGFDKWENKVRNDIDRFAKTNKLMFKNPHVYVLGRNTASCCVEFEWSFTTKSGDTIKAKGSWVYVFKKFDEVWRVVQSGGTHLYE